MANLRTLSSAAIMSQIVMLLHAGCALLACCCLRQCHGLATCHVIASLMMRSSAHVLVLCNSTCMCPSQTWLLFVHDSDDLVCLSIGQIHKAVIYRAKPSAARWKAQCQREGAEHSNAWGRDNADSYAPWLEKCRVWRRLCHSCQEGRQRRQD